MKSAPMRWLENFHAADLVRDLGHQRKHIRERNADRLPYHGMARNPEEAVQFELVRRNGELSKGVGYIGTMGNDIDGAQAVCAWLQEGAQSFHLPGLAPSTVRDLGPVKVAEIAFPYRTIHLRIPKTETPEGMVTDVIVKMNALETHDVLTFTAMIDEEAKVRFLQSGHLVLNGEYARGTTLGGMITSTVSDEIRRRLKYPERRGGMPMRQRCGSLHRECNPGTGYVLLPLIFEALLRIDELPAIAVEWDDEAPIDLVGRAARVDQKGKDAWARLTDLGHVARRVVRNAGDAKSGRTVAGHWRRGHERWHRHGPGGSLRKRIRVGPTRIGTPPQERGYTLKT